MVEEEVVVEHEVEDEAMAAGPRGLPLALRSAAQLFAQRVHLLLQRLPPDTEDATRELQARRRLRRPGIRAARSACSASCLGAVVAAVARLELERQRMAPALGGLAPRLQRGRLVL